MDKDGSGVITIEDIISVYDTSTHPDVATGDKSPQHAAEEMLSTFKQSDKVNGVVTWPEFLDYYKGLSVGIDDDQYFELMIRNAWHISGGGGNAANTTCRRVLVVHSDGSQEVKNIIFIVLYI